MTDDDNILAAWQAWDDKPGDRDRAAAMETACARTAARLDVPVNLLRIFLAASRRIGIPPGRVVAVLRWDDEGTAA